MTRRIFRTLTTILFVTALLTAILLADQAGAATFRGQLQKSTANGTVILRFQTPESESLLTIRATSDLANVLAKLRNGDRLTISGTIDPNRKEIRIEAIQTVGLQELIGAWQSSSRAYREIFEFQDFKRLNLYLPIQDEHSQVSLPQTHALSYVVAPEQADRYSIFISDDKVVMAGSIEMGERKIQLSVFDRQTGSVSQNISLSPLPLK